MCVKKKESREFSCFQIISFLKLGCLGSFLLLESLDFEILDRRLENFYPLIVPPPPSWNFAVKPNFGSFDTLEPESLLGSRSNERGA